MFPPDLLPGTEPWLADFFELGTDRAIGMNGPGPMAVQIFATFDQPARVGDQVEFQYQQQGDTSWLAMSTIMEELSAYSPVVSNGVMYNVQYRMRRGNRTTDWQGPLAFLAAADPVPPDPVDNIAVDVSVAGQATFNWDAPGSPNYAAARIYVGATSDPNAASLVRTEPGAPSDPDQYTHSLPPGTYYGWIEAVNASNAPAAKMATGSFIVS